jgi:hypothetical protein
MLFWSDPSVGQGEKKDADVMEVCGTRSERVKESGIGGENLFHGEVFAE